MRRDDYVHVSINKLVTLITKCAKQKDLKKGKKLHAKLSESRLIEKDHVVGSALVDMYAKCGLIMKAQQIFDELPHHDVVSWTALIGGYARNDLNEEALNCFEQMHFEGVKPNGLTFVGILVACGNLGDIDTGCRIHLLVENMGLLASTVVGNALIGMYTRFGLLAEACQVFEKLHDRDVTSWNALITAYVEYGYHEEAIKCFQLIHQGSINPDPITFVCILKACGGTVATGIGAEVHVHIVRQGLLQENIFVGTALVYMYAKSGLPWKACELFDELPYQDVVAWTTLIDGYVDNELGTDALQYFDQMQQKCVLPNNVTFISALSACADICALIKGQSIHTQIQKQRYFQQDCELGNTLVDMYAKCGSLHLAQEVFDELSIRNIISWNALIGGYIELGNAIKALQCFEDMQLEGVSPNAVTLIACLRACGIIQDAQKGREIHTEVERQGLLGRGLVGNALIDMYCKCGVLSKAHLVFDLMPVRDVVSWTTIISGFAESGNVDKAVQCFKQMQDEGVSPNSATLVCLLKACGSRGAIEDSQDIHIQIEKQGLFERDLTVGNALVDMYAKCGLFEIAEEMFNRLPIQDVTSWNSLITSYAENGHVEDVLNCFEKMQFKGVKPDYVTFICVLKACGTVGATDVASKIHAEIERRGLLRITPIGNTLVNMYAKSGLVTEAQHVFNKIPVQDVVTWTSLMAGYAHLGENENVFFMFDRMVGQGVKPNPITFIVLLNACTRGGLFAKCKTYFEVMSDQHGISPTVKHHGCIVDLLSRAGQLDDAMGFVKKMPFSPNFVLQRIMLNACKNAGNEDLGAQLFENSLLGS